MRLARAVAAAYITVVACCASTTAAFVVGAGFASSSVQTTSTCSKLCVETFATSTLGSTHDRQRNSPQLAARELRAAASDAEEEEGGGGGGGGGGGFTNPYTAFRKWQMELIVKKATSNEKYPEAIAGLMKEPGMTMPKAERLARLAVSDPILYAIERRKEANEINGTPMDYNKISGFFPMEWIMSGDFGWGFNKKKKRLEEEAKKKK